MDGSSVYVQCGTVGLASYHFEENEWYISYSAADPSWKLDDGCPPPVKKPFEKGYYDPSTRMFTAVVNWYPVAFGGGVQWYYRMVFSADNTKIEKGEVLSYGAAGETRSMLAFGRDLIYVKHQ